MVVDTMVMAYALLGVPGYGLEAAKALKILVEMRGIEPLASALRTPRSPS